MITKEEIRALKHGLTCEEAIDKLRHFQQGLTDKSEKAIIEAEIGKLYWRLGKRAEAMSAYEASAQMDPDGPGGVLVAHSVGIMDFFCPDLLNP